MHPDWRNDFIEQCVFRMDESTERIQKCLGMLSETEIWERPNGASNAIGNLVLHLCGNIGQYILSSLGGAPDARVRDAEFAASGGYTRQQLLELHARTAAEARAVVLAADTDNLLRVRTVQGFQLSGIGIVVHVVEHYSYHTGQIALRTKQLRDQGLGFYAGMDLNVKNG